MNKMQLKAYVMVDAELPGNGGSIPVMVSIMAPSKTAGGRKVGVDLVLVFNIRNGSKVPKNCNQLLEQAVKVVVQTLGDKDRLAILPVQSVLSEMSAEVRAAASDTVSAAAFRSKSPLVTDLESAELMLHDRKREEKERRMGHIIVISNSNDDMRSLESLLPWRFHSVHAFGFRGAGNARTMHNVAANSRECTYAIIDDEYGQITQAFNDTIERITSAVTAMPIEVKIKCEQNVVLLAIDAPLVSYFISSNKKTGIIWASAHLASANGVGTNFVVHLGGMGNVLSYEWSNLFKVEAMYDRVSGILADVKNYDQVSNKIEGHVVKIMRGESMSKEVVAEVVRFKAVNVIDSIISTTAIKINKHRDELHAAANKLCEEKGKIYKDSDCGREAMEGTASGLAAEMDEMEIRLYNNYLWREYMLSWLSHQRWKLPLPPLFMDKQAAGEGPVQLEIFANPDHHKQQGGRHPFPVLLRVRVPETGFAKLKLPFFDVIVVVDGSRREEEPGKLKYHDKLELVKKAVNVILEKLTHKDRLCILPVQMSVTQPAAVLLEMSEEGRRETIENLQFPLPALVLKEPTSAPDGKQGSRPLPQLRRPSYIYVPPEEVPYATLNVPHQINIPKTSRWKEQLKKTVKKVRNFLDINPTDSAFPTKMSIENQQTTSMTVHSVHAADGSTKLWKVLMDATKVLDGRLDMKKDRVGCIIIISDSDDDGICQEKLSSKYNIHAFGFSGMHNARAMYDIASRSNGIYDVLNDGPDQITEAFKSCINKITSTIVVDTEIEVACRGSSSVALSTIECGKFKSTGKSTIHVGALHATTVKNFIFYMDNVSEEDDHGNLFTARVKCVPAFRKENKTPGLNVTRNRIDVYSDEEVAATTACVDAANIITMITYPKYHEQLVAHAPIEIDTMREILERVMDKLNINLNTDIAADPNYNEKLVQRLPWEMWLKDYQQNLAAGKTRRQFKKKTSKPERSYQLSSEVSYMEESLTKKMKMEADNLRTEINDPNYYENLADRLVLELSPQIPQIPWYSADKARLMKKKMAVEMESIETYLSTQLMTDPNNIDNSRELVEHLVEKMCDTCAKIAQDHGEPQLASGMHEMRERLQKDMVDLISKKMAIPDYYRKLMLCIARLICLNDCESERARSRGRYALMMEKMELTIKREMDMKAEPYDQKLLVLLVREMLIKVFEYALVAGETRLSREMEEMEESLQYKKTNDPNYYKELVANKLSYLLSWLALKGLCEQPQLD